MNNSTIQLLDIHSDDCILEIGFGGGSLLDEMLSREPAKVVGAEISDLALIEARKRFTKAIAGGRLELENLQTERLPFRSGTFSKVCCVNVVYFWDDLAAMISEVHRVLRTGGQFVVSYQETGPNNRETPPASIERYLMRGGLEVLWTSREQDNRNGTYFTTAAHKPPVN